MFDRNLGDLDEVKENIIMNYLGEATEIRGRRIRNRIVKAPVVCFSFSGDGNGPYGKQHVDHYLAWSAGGLGLIIIQATAVAGATAGTGAWSPKQQDLLKTIAMDGHRHGAVMMMQLGSGDLNINAMSREQISLLQDDFLAAVKAARQAGYDGVEIHAAHGYTLCKFLDQGSNMRADQYGGQLENRVRILSEIWPKIRQAGGDDFILGIRFGGNLANGSPALDLARSLEALGADLLHVSFGLTIPEGEIPEGFPGLTAYYGAQIKKAVRVPVIGVGAVFDGATAHQLVKENCLDYVALGRASLADPKWAEKVLSSHPVNQCHNCGGRHRSCWWFKDHTRCPARLLAAGALVD